MIDFHSHIIYGVDDGAETENMSVRMVKQAKIAGFHGVILTPHYMEDYYECPAIQIKKKMQLIKELCKKEGIDVELYQANEVYINNNIVDLLKDKAISTINGSRYILFEIPMNEEPINLLEVIYKLKENGNIPILAHPERYTFIQKNPNKLLEIADLGVLFQSNYGSIVGLYGKEAKKTVKLLIKNNYIHFLGTDIHRPATIYGKVNWAKDELRKIISEEQIEDLTENNARKVLNDENLDVQPPRKIKVNFFKKIFSK